MRYALDKIRTHETREGHSFSRRWRDPAKGGGQAQTITKRRRWDSNPRDP